MSAFVKPSDRQAGQNNNKTTKNTIKTFTQDNPYTILTISLGIKPPIPLMGYTPDLWARTRAKSILTVRVYVCTCETSRNTCQNTVNW